MMSKREKIKRIVEEEDEEKFKKMVKDELEFEDVQLFLELIRKKRMEELYEKLEIDRDKLKKAKAKKIKLSPDSVKWPLLSSIYRDKKGKYKVEDLLFEYHDSVLAEGMEIGIETGKQVVIMDIKNGKLKKDDINRMSEDDIEEYINKNIAKL